MLPKYSEIGLVFIKPQNKEGNDAIKTALYGVNDIVYKWCKKYADAATATTISNQITQIGVELSKAECSGRCLPKKNEVLQSLRLMVRGLKDFAQKHPTIQDDDARQVDATIRYFMQDYIKRRSNLTGIECIELLEEWNRINSNMCVDDLRVVVNNSGFNSVPKEIVEFLALKYSPAHKQAYSKWWTENTF